MSIDALLQRLPDFAKDTRLNLSSLQKDDTLALQTRSGLLIACASATRNADVIAAIEGEVAHTMQPAALSAAKAAACIMAMNNVYYRFVHLAGTDDYTVMPARLRMNVIANPGVAKSDFELWSLAVSAINGCGACVQAHERELRQHGIPAATIQTAVRYAAILQSVSVALETVAASRVPIAAE